MYVYIYNKGKKAEKKEESAEEKEEVVPEMEDKTLECRDCSAEFVFTVGEQDFFKDKGFDKKPTRCGECKTVKKARFDEGGGGGGGGRGSFRGGFGGDLGGGCNGVRGTVCCALQNGECTRGDGCRFSHS